MIDAIAARFDRRLVVTLIGPSGSGKSTLVNALAGGAELSETGHRRPTTGRLMVFGSGAEEADGTHPGARRRGRCGSARCGRALAGGRVPDRHTGHRQHGQPPAPHRARRRRGPLGCADLRLRCRKPQAPGSRGLSRADRAAFRRGVAGGRAQQVRPAGRDRAQGADPAGLSRLHPSVLGWGRRSRPLRFRPPARAGTGLGPGGGPPARVRPVRRSAPTRFQPHDPRRVRDRPSGRKRPAPARLRVGRGPAGAGVRPRGSGVGRSAA